MRSDYIRKQTGLIIRKDNLYLVGKEIIRGDLRWSLSPWDAWKTRIPAKAKSVQMKTGGEIYLFNPVVAQIRRYEEHGYA